MEGFYAEVRLFAGSTAPKNWAFCDGSLIKVRDNVALFSLIGNLYGGDAKEDFALPDLRGRIVIAAAPDNGTSTYDVAEVAGADQVPSAPVQANGGGAPTLTLNSVVPGVGNNVQPVLGLNYIICVRGTFPDRVSGR